MSTGSACALGVPGRPARAHARGRPRRLARRTLNRRAPRFLHAPRTSAASALPESALDCTGGPCVSIGRVTSGCSSVVERDLAKVDVVGSSPITRSTPIRPQVMDLRAFSFCLASIKSALR